MPRTDQIRCTSDLEIFVSAAMDRHVQWVLPSVGLVVSVLRISVVITSASTPRGLLC